MMIVLNTKRVARWLWRDSWREISALEMKYLLVFGRFQWPDLGTSRGTKREREENRGGNGTCHVHLMVIPCVPLNPYSHRLRLDSSLYKCLFYSSIRTIDKTSFGKKKEPAAAEDVNFVWDRKKGNFMAGWLLFQVLFSFCSHFTARNFGLAEADD